MKLKNKDNIVFIWYNVLVFNFLYNIKTTDFFDKSNFTSSLYICSCIFRGLNPICWSQEVPMSLRASIFSTRLSDQFISHIGESAFAYQLSKYLYKDEKHSYIKFLYLLIWLIARPCCWIGIITNKKIFHVYEESTWTVFITFVMLKIRIKKQNKKYKHLLSLAIISYVYYMLKFDILMYYEQSKNINSYNLYEGVDKAKEITEITWKYKHWKDDMGWMLIYFTIGPIISKHIRK